MMLNVIAVALLAALLIVSVLTLLKVLQLLRLNRERVLQHERLMNDFYQEKALDLMCRIQEKLRMEHDLLKSELGEKGGDWKKIDALFVDGDRNFSTAIKIVRESRRMYEERMRRIDLIA